MNTEKKRRRSNTILPQKVRDKATVLYQCGIPISDIAKLYHCNYNDVYSFVKKRNVRSYELNDFKERHKRDVLLLYSVGLSLPCIASLLNIPKYALRYITKTEKSYRSKERLMRPSTFEYMDKMIDVHEMLNNGACAADVKQKYGNELGSTLMHRTKFLWPLARLQRIEEAIKKVKKGNLYD